MKKTIIFIFVMSIFFGFSCKKKNVDPETPYTDNFSGKQIRYVVAVVAAENSIGQVNAKSDTPIIDIKNAKVTLVQNDSIQSRNVDDKGMVHFSNLFTGNTIVKIECDGYTTANLIVNLSNYDTVSSNNYVIVSTIVTLFPISEDKDMATIHGKLFADTDLTVSGLEPVTEPLLIRASIDLQNIYDYLNHSQVGQVLSFAYEGASFTTTSENGNYSIKVSSSLKALKFLINSDNFVVEQKISPTQTVRKIFSLNTQTVSVYPKSVLVKDLIFE